MTSRKVKFTEETMRNLFDIEKKCNMCLHPSKFGTKDNDYVKKGP